MKVKVFLIAGVIIILSIGFFAYSIPYGKKITTFSMKYSNLKNQIEADSQGLGGDRGIDKYSLALDNIPQDAASFKALASDYTKLSGESNFIRNLWRRQSVSSQMMKNLGDRVDELYKLVNPGILNAFGQLAESRRNAYVSAQDIEAIGKVTAEYTADLKKLSNSIMSLNKHLSDPALSSDHPAAKTVNLSVISGMSNKVTAALDAGLSSVQRMAKSSERDKTNALESSPNVRNAVDIVKDRVAWIENAKRNTADLAALGAPFNRAVELDEELSTYANRAKVDLELIERVIDSQRRSNEELKDAMIFADVANNRLQNLERFASAGQIAEVHEQWRLTGNQADKAKAALKVQVKTEQERKIADNLLAGSQDTVNSIIGRIASHRNFVYSKYEEARREESTILGSTKRAAQRGLDRLRSFIGGAVAQASESRIGKEISVSVKALILGTKAFYDLMDPNTDPVSWAFSYQGDVDQLMRETDKAMRMPGPSITGKNTIIEDLVNRGYDASFKHK